MAGCYCKECSIVCFVIVKLKCSIYIDQRTVDKHVQCVSPFFVLYFVVKSHLFNKSELNAIALAVVTHCFVISESMLGHCFP